MAQRSVGRPKGLPKTGGRAKGVPNKVTRDLKEMILGALDDAGGRKYLLAQAKVNPVAFMTLIGKVLPTTLANDPDNPITGLTDEQLDERLAVLLAKREAAG